MQFTSQYKHQLFKNAEINFNILVGNKTYFEFQTEMYYHREVIFIEANCPHITTLIDEVNI